MKILFDTDTVIDYLTNNFSNEEIKIIDNVFKKHECGISVKSAADIHYYLNESFDDKKAKEIRDVLNSSFRILDISDESGINIPGSDEKDYEKKIMITTALSNGYDCIVTRNGESFINSSIRILSIRELTDNI